MWVLHIDGASNTQDSRASFILINFERIVIEYILWFNFKGSNNQAEYEVLLANLKIAKELDINNLKVFTDSQLITGQVKNEFEAWDSVTMKYLQKMKDLTSILKYFEISYILRVENIRADVLSRLTTTSFSLLDQTFIKYFE